jgi:hypothetical protein
MRAKADKQHDNGPVELQAVQTLITVAQCAEQTRNRDETKIALAVLDVALDRLEPRCLARIAG